MQPEQQENEKISYCVNALLCSELINVGHEREFCHSCGSSLLIGGRYRAIALLRPFGDTEKTLYEAIDTETGEHVALKIINWAQSKMLKFLEREHHFLMTAGSPFPYVNREAYFSWAPDAENDFYEVFVLVLPLEPGINSQRWVEENGALSESQAVAWLIQASGYLSKLAEKSYIHRDIKPSNFMVDEDQTLTLIDFESVREMDQDYLSGIEEMSWDDENKQYRRFTKFYSLGYTAPEQARGLPLPQSDFYALGRTAMFWVTGVESTDLGDGLDNQTIDWSEVNPELSKTFVDFLEWLTDRDPRQRPTKASLISGFLENTYPKLLMAEQLGVTGHRWNWKTISKGVGVVVVAVAGMVGVWYGTTEHLYSRAVSSFERTQYNQSQDYLKQVLLLNPFHGGAYYYQGLLCHGQHDYDCAEQNYQKSIRWSRNPAGGQYQLGVLKEDLGQDSEAQSYYLKSIQSRESPEAYNRLARLAIQEPDLEQAQTYLDLGLKLADDDDMKARLLAQQGRVYFEQKEWSKAEQALKDSAKIENSAESFCLLPQVLQKQNRSQKDINGWWYKCFYSPAQYSEGDSFKGELLRIALPQLFLRE